MLESLASLVVALTILQSQLNTAQASELSKPDLIAYATQVAEENHLNTEHFLAVADCESGWNRDAVGDHGTSFGVFQIHLPAHPDITKEMAENPYFAIPWAAKQWVNDNADAWSCWTSLYGHK